MLELLEEMPNGVPSHKVRLVKIKFKKEINKKRGSDPTCRLFFSFV